MIAMQYSFTLPADYDMGIVHDRISSRGNMTDQFPGLIFKAYLHASKSTAPTNSVENLYAPFYLWDSSAAMNDFLCGPGFAGVSQAFGWPAVKLWSVLHQEIKAGVENATYATRRSSAITPYTDLITLREAEIVWAKQVARLSGCLAVVSAYDPHTWTWVSMQLWSDASAAHDAGLTPDVQGYQVGHMSVPGQI